MILCLTTILAQQHYETFFSRFAPFDLKVKRALVLSHLPERLRISGGTVDVLVGTHRLLHQT